jgi:subtilisin family serine protease
VVESALQGPEVVLAAPGADYPVLAPARNGRFEGYQLSVTGTSAAAAIVSGAAALVRSRFPQLPARDVIQRLLATATDAGPAGRDPQYGFGQLNLVRALTVDVPAVSQNPLLAGATASASPVAGGDAARRGPPAVLLVAAVAAGAVVLLLVAIGVGGWLVLRRRRT